MPDFYQRTAYPDTHPTFDFSDAVPAGLLVYLGTNDYSAGENPTLDAEFTAAFLQFMGNVTTKWYGTSTAPAKVGCDRQPTPACSWGPGVMRVEWVGRKGRGCPEYPVAGCAQRSLGVVWATLPHAHTVLRTPRTRSRSSQCLVQ